ncbi:MAG: hypothetical protein R6W73_05430 [Candidatus Saliniplasma sp.]
MLFGYLNRILISSGIWSTVTVLEATTDDPSSATQVGEVGGNRQKSGRSALSGRS